MTAPDYALSCTLPAETAMNKRSSRAHTVLVLTASHSMGDRVATSSLHLVDLAGRCVCAWWHL